MGNITFHNIGAFLHHKRRKEETFMLTNVFVKPNEQNRACSSYAMARKRRMKSNVFVKPNGQNRACSSYAMARKRRMKSNVTAPPDYYIILTHSHRLPAFPRKRFQNFISFR